jgi:hypothetical protein
MYRSLHIIKLRLLLNRIIITHMEELHVLGVSKILVTVRTFDVEAILCDIFCGVLTFCRMIVHKKTELGYYIFLTFAK